MNARTPSGFDGLGIAPALLAALDKLNFREPTPIQRRAIPIAIEGKDMIGIAQTGTGKTLAFGIPMLQRIARLGGRGLVVLPTRELAIQVDEQLHKIGRVAGLRTAVLIGGASMHMQLDHLRKNPHIIVATPGRLIDHMDQRTVNLHDIKTLVLDEADRMLDMGFMPQIRKILASVPRERQTMLFSATMPDDIVRIASQHMQMPVRIEVARAGTAAELVQQELFVVRKDQKNRLLDKLLDEHKGSVLVFTRTKFGAKKLARAVKAMQHTVSDIHSDRSLAQRRDALEGFKSGKYRVLVATDIAARGIDVTGIELVVNYDVPENADDYVHRIGRTGRAGHTGKAVTFATPDQGDEVRQIEKLVRRELPISSLPELPPERPMPPGMPFREQRPFGGRSRGSTGSPQSRPQRGQSGPRHGSSGAPHRGGTGGGTPSGPRHSGSSGGRPSGPRRAGGKESHGGYYFGSIDKKA